MDQFKVGDRVLFNPGNITGVIDRVTFPTYRILYGLNAMYCHHSELELDKQWYREQQLNKILKWCDRKNEEKDDNT